MRAITLGLLAVVNQTHQRARCVVYRLAVSERLAHIPPEFSSSRCSPRECVDHYQVELPKRQELLTEL